MYYFAECENKFLVGGKMVVMDLQVTNFYGLKDFHMNMAYPKRIVGSILENEYLVERENFRYKKVNIIMGGNATGKTSIGKMLMRIFNFIDKKSYSHLTSAICDTTAIARFSVDFVSDRNSDYTMYRVETEVTPKTGETYIDSDILVSVKKVTIGKKDSYESCVKKIEEQVAPVIENYVQALEGLGDMLAWLFCYPTQDVKLSEKILTDTDLKILNYTLKTLDPAILSVQRLEEVEDSYVIKAKNYTLIVQEGKVVNEDYLSSGTRAGLDIANIICSIKSKRNNFYYCDEKFSYVQSEVEKTFLTLMVRLLGPNDQLFFTTHNTDVLDLPFPKHSFSFLKKELDGVDFSIKYISASTYLKRNTDSLRNAVENDLFSTMPSLDLLYQIEEL